MATEHPPEHDRFEEEDDDDVNIFGLLDLLDPFTLPPRHLVGIAGLLVLAIAPFFVEQITLLRLMGAMYFAMFAMSWDSVSGYTGDISFGHALFFTMGGYTSALLNLEFGLPLHITIPAGVLMAALAGLALGFPALRLRGPYLSLLTLIAPLVVLQLFIFYSGIFGGELGLPSPDPLVDMPWDERVAVNYYIALGLFTFILGLLWVVTRSDAGLIFYAIRQDPDAVASAGLNVAKFRIYAFVLSGAVGGLAGAFFVHSVVGGPQPSQLLDLLVSIEVIVATIIGGIGTIVGAAIGGLFFYLALDWLARSDATIPLLDVAVADANFLIFALLTLLILYYAPGGMLRWVLDGAETLGRIRRGEPPEGGPKERSVVEQIADRYRRELPFVADELQYDPRTDPDRRRRGGER